MPFLARPQPAGSSGPGARVALDVGQRAVVEAVVAGADPAQTKPVIERLAHEFCQEYLGAIEVPSQKVQEEYDRLTDHGRNDVPEQKAIDAAMKKGS